MTAGRHVRVVDQVYKATFHFWHGPEQRMVDACHRDGFREIAPHHGAGRTIWYRPSRGGLVVHVWIDGRYRLREPFAVGCLAHEAVHAALGVFEHIGEKAVSVEAQEPFCYLVEWVVREYSRRVAS